MMLLLSFVIFFVLGLASAVDVPAPKFSVDLDAPAISRWDEPVKYMIDTYGFDHSFQNVIDYMHSFLPQSVLDKLEPELEMLLDSFPDNYSDEIRGIWRTIDAEGYGDRLSVGELAAINLMYELTVFCTSILAEDSDGNVYHGRNLDYSINGLQNLTATIDFTRGGDIVYHGTEFVGYVGLLTGMKPSAFSFSVDQREMMDQHKNNFPKWENLKGVLENLVSGVKGGGAVGMFLRTMADEEENFEDALESIKTVPLIAPVYIMVAGITSGSAAVVTRDRLKPDDTMGEGVWPLDVDGGAYWRLETNYDHWVDVPDTDNRRDPANECMEKVGLESVSLSSIYACLSTPPVLCSGTVYTTLMHPGTGEFTTTIRNQD